jgi:hypothetical protein
LLLSSFRDSGGNSTLYFSPMPPFGNGCRIQQLQISAQMPHLAKPGPQEAKVVPLGL